MNITSNETVDEIGTTRTTLLRDHDEDLLSYDTSGFYRIHGYVLSGHDIGCMERVAWDSSAQEWKAVP